MDTKKISLALVVVLLLVCSIVYGETPENDETGEILKPEFRINLCSGDNFTEDVNYSTNENNSALPSLQKFWYKPRFDRNVSIYPYLEMSLFRYDGEKSQKWEFLPDRYYNLDMKREWLYDPEYVRKRYARFYPGRYQD